MSLLMEALRKAEEAKRKGQEQQAPAEPPAADEGSVITPEATPRPHTAFTLEPLDIPSPPASEQPDPGVMALQMPPPYEPEPSRAVPNDQTLSMDQVDNFLDTAPAPQDNIPERPRRTRTSGQTRDQLAAASVFAARKQAPKRNKHLKILLPVLALAIPLVGIGLWFLSQLQGDSLAVNPSIANYNPNRGFLEDQLVVEDSAIDATETETPVIATDLAAAEPIEDPPAPDTATTALATPAAPDPAPALPTAAAPQPVAPPAAAPEPTAQAGIELPVAEPASSTRLQISRSQGRSEVNSTLQTAWNTLQTGDTGRALLLYQEVLAEMPNNRDALLGLAAIQERSGQSEQARQLYVRLLALNPQDPLARAGLLQGMQAGSAPAQEGELRALLNRYPELAPLHFALGNLYAGQQRWSEAQNAYFTALLHAGRGNNGPVSPDYAFNLAVSLEQLQQPRVALDYYRQARDLSLTSPPGFDPEQLRSRLAILEQNQP